MKRDLGMRHDSPPTNAVYGDGWFRVSSCDACTYRCHWLVWGPGEACLNCGSLDAPSQVSARWFPDSGDYYAGFWKTYEEMIDVEQT